MISWKTQEKVLPIDTSHISRGYVEIEKKISSSVSKFGGKFMEANGWCPSWRSYISNTSYDREDLMVGNYYC